MNDEQLTKHEQVDFKDTDMQAAAVPGRAKIMMLPPMSSLHWLQGTAADLAQDIRLCIMIQPNCPGCHMHALPTANKISRRTDRPFDVWCLSTAFEDFEWNTVENARKLLSGELVGVARQSLGPTTEHVPTMPVAHDILTPKAEAGTELIRMALAATKQNAREQVTDTGIPQDKLEIALSRLGPEVLPEKVAHAFYSSRALGTPTWILHRASGEILDRRFGHMNEGEIFEWVEKTQM